MADKDEVMSELTIDSILEDVKELTNNDDKTKLWSLDEIDALLSDSKGDENVTLDSTDEIDAYMEKVMADIAQPDEVGEQLSKEETVETIPEEVTETADTVQETAQESKKTEFHEKKVSAPVSHTDISEEDIEKDRLRDGFTQQFRAVIEENIPKTVETVSISDETSGSIGLKEFARRNAIEAESATDNDVEADADTYEDLFSDSADEDIEPLLEGTELSDDESEEPSENHEKTQILDVPGQISIEKTRLFNEVETRAVRDENITHHIGENKIIRTGEIPHKSTLEADPYRERFLNRPQLDIEKTQEHKEFLSKQPAKTIEKHGVIVRKPDNEKTGEDGLSPVPILVDALDEYDAQKKLEMETQTGALKANALEELDNQIVLDGFTEDDEINIVDEYEEEQKLRKVRKERADNFRLFPNLHVDDEKQADDADGQVYEAESEEPDEQAVTDKAPDEAEEFEKREEKVRVAREFFGPKDSKPVYEIYLKQFSNAKIKIVVSAVALAIMLISSIATSFFGSFAMFADSPAVYTAINLLLVAVVGAVNYKSVLNGIDAVKRKRANSGTAILVAVAAAIIQCIVAFGFGDLVLSGTHIYAAVSVFTVLLINIGDLFTVKNDINNFLLLIKKYGELYSVSRIEDEIKAFEVGRGLMIKDPDVRYCSKVGFPDRFVEMSKTKDATREMFTLVLPVAAAAAFIVGIISGIINKNFFVGVSSFTGVLLMGVPSAAVLSAADIMRKVNKTLKADNAMISGWAAVDDALESNAVVIDSSDLFENGNSTIYGVKLFNSMRIDEAILYTAAVVIQSDSALRDVFDGVILSKREMLPNVESLAYEEKLGCSGWIYNYRVLVGNRELLVKHNVEVQSKEEEAKFLKNGRRAIYLAVEGKICAMFVVKYNADTATADYMKKLEQSGVSILVRTTDANITEEFIEQHFDLPHNFIKVISPVAGLMFKELAENEIPSEPCRIVNDGTLSSLLRSFSAAFTINDKHKMGMILQYIGIGLGIIIMSLLSFISGLTQAGITQVLLFEALWAVIVVFVPRLKKI